MHKSNGFKQGFFNFRQNLKKWREFVPNPFELPKKKPQAILLTEDLFAASILATSLYDVKLQAMFCGDAYTTEQNAMPKLLPAALYERHGLNPDCVVVPTIVVNPLLYAMSLFGDVCATEPPTMLRTHSLNLGCAVVPIIFMLVASMVASLTQIQKTSIPKKHYCCFYKSFKPNLLWSVSLKDSIVSC